MEILDLFLAILKASLLSVGGLSSLPLLQQELVGSGLVSERQMLEALTIGRLSTGPNGFYIISLGYFALGWAGAATALAAVILPPLSLVAFATAFRHLLLTSWAAGIVRGIGLSTAGLLMATGIQLIAPEVPLLAIPWWQAALAAIATVLTARGGGVHPGLLVLAGALVGVVLAR